MNELGIYVHIPFCKQKCYYCDFISYSNKEKIIHRYIESMIKEIQNIEKSLDNKQFYNVTTIYIGGGTPSFIESTYINELLCELKSTLKKCRNVKLDLKEITIEVNPGIINKEKLNQYKESGINRVSIGLQSTNDKLLKQIGRIHSYNDFLQAYELVKKVGINNINVDLIIGLPNQTINDVSDSIQKIIKMCPTHISMYSLIVEEGTKLSNQIKHSEISLPNEDLEREMYWFAKRKLEENGYNHYEISNFAKKDYESMHNKNCWEQKEYIGIGVAAHSYINNIRKSNINDVEKYIANIEKCCFERNVIIHEEQTIEDTKLEYMLLGLRKINGVSIQKFKNKFGDNPIFIYKNKLEYLINEKLLTIDGDTIKLTNKGLDFANIVWEEFVM